MHSESDSGVVITPQNDIKGQTLDQTLLKLRLAKQVRVTVYRLFLSISSLILRMSSSITARLCIVARVYANNSFCLNK